MSPLIENNFSSWRCHQKHQILLLWIWSFIYKLANVSHLHYNHEQCECGTFELFVIPTDGCVYFRCWNVDFSVTVIWETLAPLCCSKNVLSFCAEFAFSHSVCWAFLLVLRLFPSVQKHASIFFTLSSCWGSAAYIPKITWQQVKLYPEHVISTSLVNKTKK